MHVVSLGDLGAYGELSFASTFSYACVGLYILFLMPLCFSLSPSLESRKNKQTPLSRNGASWRMATSTTYVCYGFTGTEVGGTGSWFPRLRMALGSEKRAACCPMTYCVHGRGSKGTRAKLPRSSLSWNKSFLRCPRLTTHTLTHTHL